MQTSLRYLISNQPILDVSRRTFSIACKLLNSNAPYKSMGYVEKKKRINSELQLLRDEGEFFVPNKIPLEHWDNLLDLHTKNQRLRYYRYLKKIEIARDKEEIAKTERRIKYKQKVERHDANPHIAYGLGRNSMFFHIRKSAISRFYNTRIASSIIFSQKLVLDLGYNENMDECETKNCIRQIEHLYAFNKTNREPFDIHFCNLKSKSNFANKLSSSFGTLKSPKSIITATEKSYLDIFPKEKLVYLTPDCDIELNRYNYDDVYIIGGLVDHRPIGPVCMAKAKREGLRIARFPLDKYLNWTKGQKALTLDQVFKILLTLKNTRSWIKALEHVPERKLN